MTPTDILREEHELILAMLDVMSAVCTRMEKSETIEVTSLDQIIDFIRTFADKCHHAKEENVLFPALEAAGFPREGGPVGVMLQEHAMGREFVKNMATARDGISRGSDAAGNDFTQNARGYVELLTNHIHKENNILFVMAEQRLTPDEVKRVGREFELIEREEIGEGVHERYHSLLHELCDMYLR
ncbi:MAG TPA: hemerythrin domain-containing protein [Spirochaetota bacterium]|nr:hemerythrin domain-containing protein [Spirochaetota bacterium]